jgi:hypothetical protein
LSGWFEAGRSREPAAQYRERMAWFRIFSARVAQGTLASVINGHNGGHHTTRFERSSSR